MFELEVPEVTTVVGEIGAGQLEGRYFDRMARSLGHKGEMLRSLVPGSVLDIGAGGGELSRAALRHGATKVFALDTSPDAIARLDTMADITPLLGMADQVDRLLPANSLDNVLCSAVLHEVFSYGSSDGRRRDGALALTLKNMARVLKRGGRLIVRDGVLPDDYRAGAQMRFLPAFEQEGEEALAKYRELSPFGFQFERRDSAWHGSLHALTEFAFTYTWGVDTFHREAREQYQLHTLQGYADYVRSTTGLHLRHAEAVVQSGYHQQLDPRLKLTVNGRRRFPATNATWVYEKLDRD